ncbi:hypothetical protein C8A05DRAFT_30293 [Staphylotrichum tortipilum]|uniref:Lysyl-tRNA synthetase n=1 Tax=Staphylotrichum tortipilum TaxID=2831512 RepID=A0AAN6MRQ8_9PEZI|nr:hypothetical protein C8A05DRAFT_30293 [Staphylotrichum longicolle]
MRLRPGLQLLRRHISDASAPRVLSRRQELERANALKYPRLRHHAPVVRIPDFRAKHVDIEAGVVDPDEVTLHGRIETVRTAGSKLVFLDLTAEFDRVQGVCNLGKLADGTTVQDFKARSKLLIRGDIVAVTGRATRTSTGELSIQATRLPEVLTPTIAALPTSLIDDESRMRHRHIDMLVNRKTTDTLRLRSYIIKYMRDFFHDRNFLEFQTPILAADAGGAAARPFTVSSNAISRDVSLRIAPELWLKRLVVGGVDRVFELGPAFRNEGIDLTHNPEFTICEFYHAYANLPDLISVTEDLIRGLATHCHSLSSTKLTSLPPIDLAPFQVPFQQAEFIPTLESALGFTFPNLTSPTALPDLLTLLKANNTPPDVIKEANTLPQLLDNLAAAYIEPLSATAPLFVIHQPVCMSPLAKSFTCPKTGQAVSARTELFMGARELANMYEEENDPDAQHRKFLDQAAERTAEGENTVVDDGYVEALESGLPPTGGWGCGVERLVMLFSGSKRISDCLSFGNLKNVAALGAGAKGHRQGSGPGQEEKGSVEHVSEASSVIDGKEVINS